MIEIKQVTNQTIAKQICRENGAEWRPEYHVIATIDHENILQCAVFSYKGEVGEIHVISGFHGDIDLLDGLCRAILNIMDINGVKEVYLPVKYQKIAQKIGFDLKKNQYHLTLDGFFRCCCGK